MSTRFYCEQCNACHKIKLMTQAGLEPAVPVTPCALHFLTGDSTRIVSGYQRSYTATCSGGRVATLTTHRSQFNKLTS